jgi:hypothetical protein
MYMAALGALRFPTVFLLVAGTAAAAIPANQAAYDRRSASDAGLYENSALRAIARARPALDAGIPVGYAGPSLKNFENRPGTDRFAQGASRTGPFVEFQRHHVF